ncbi:hypothetical protein RIU45_11370 [Riemerella anatipestifer]|uniref:hypothetical protein n=1 Tax=Riemerella anatipestifer TaxID=34085 RepID=UPI0028602C4D|nr:hypothetical protein [Riemerella anatipestifer]MDR7795556.1 hypothetical protein [Riemerella anatipestifer]
MLLLEDNSFIVRVVKRLGQNAILGIQNSDASKHKFVRNYNNTNWTESGNIAYLFTPNQTLTPSAKWFVDGVERSTDRNFTYLPVNDAERLKAEITFSDGTTPVGNPISQEVEFKKVLTPSISSERQTGCALRVINFLYKTLLRVSYTNGTKKENLLQWQQAILL